MSSSVIEVKDYHEILYKIKSGIRLRVYRNIIKEM